MLLDPRLKADFVKHSHLKSRAKSCLAAIFEQYQLDNDQDIVKEHSTNQSVEKKSLIRR